MDITANFLDPNIEAAIDGDDQKLATPLQRLTHNAMSGEEVMGLLQRHWLLPQLQKELIIDALSTQH
jgi:hypothetical protein